MVFVLLFAGWRDLDGQASVRDSPGGGAIQQQDCVGCALQVKWVSLICLLYLRPSKYLDSRRAFTGKEAFAIGGGA